MRNKWLSGFPALYLVLGILSVWTIQTIAFTSGTSAQSVLQNNSGGLQQPQGSQTQSSFNTQPQTSGLQNNGNSQSVLDQSKGQSLGVVSDPDQSVPETVSQPSQTLKTDIFKSPGTTGTNWAPIITSLVLLIALPAGIYMFARWANRNLPEAQPAGIIAEAGKPVLQDTDPVPAADSSPEHRPAKRIKSKKPKKSKKRKKPHQR